MIKSPRQLRQRNSTRDRRTNRICWGLTIIGVILAAIGVAGNNGTMISIGATFAMLAVITVR